MNGLKVFEYMVLWHPSKDEEKDGKKSKIAVDLVRCLAKDANMANMMAIKAIPEEYATQLDQLEVAVRPF